MATPPPRRAPASTAFLASFRAHAGATGRLRFEEFMRLALYDPASGYYRRPRTRVGYGTSTDFYTASTSGPIFGELVAAAAAGMLVARGASPSDYRFVEIGPESGGGVLAEVAHPFAPAQCLRLGEPLELSGRCVVFSNELFDAQPCARYRRTSEGWAEVGVELGEDGLRETLQPLDPPPPFLPANAPEGYHFDAPRAARALAQQIGGQRWQGLFLAFDYGKSLAELASDTPAGTVRAYFRHTQSTDLLAQPGEQDLTCHICWDWIADALRENGFEVDPVSAQERFLVTRASDALQRMMAAEAGRFSRRKLSLLQLLHPAHLGRKFQVLSAWRG